MLFFKFKTNKTRGVLKLELPPRGSEARKRAGFTDCSVDAGPFAKFRYSDPVDGVQNSTNQVPLKIPRIPIDPLSSFESIPLENRNPLGFPVLRLKTAAPRS
jgi:hypothetical protein